jgi:hypothetical protein
MRQFMKKAVSLLLVMAVAMGPSAVFAEGLQGAGTDKAIVSSPVVPSATISSAVSQTAQYISGMVTNPVISSIGGEWAVLGLARAGAKVPEGYYDNYYSNVVSELKEKNGNLSNVKYTEYSRLILALTASGRDVTNVGGYNLLEKLSDFNSVVKQGINGAIFALIALDSGNYSIPKASGTAIQTTREILVDHILSREVTTDQGEKGGFSLTGDAPDPDITGMALQALAQYKDKPKVKAAIDRSLAVLNELQLANAGYETGGIENSESTAQVIVAKSALGIDSGSNVAALMKYFNSDGSFRHVLTGAANQMATEQAFYALVAYDRFLQGKNPLYHMTDTVSNAIKVSLNGKYLAFDQNPVNVDGRVLVPMRGIFEAIGASVIWDGSTRKVSGTLGDRTIELVIGEKTAKIDGKAVAMDVPASIVNGNTMVPVRFISESLKKTVEWQKENNTVEIRN